MNIIKAECTWGDGPDVLLTVYNRQYDMTVEEARKLACELLQAAEQAERLERLILC